MNLVIKLINKYRSALETKKRYVIFSGGRASAKSFHGQAITMLTSYEAGHTILNMRYTLTNANDSIIPEFQEKIDLAEVPHHFHKTGNNIINLESGSRVLFRGMRTSSGNQTAKLKGTKGLSMCVLDEAEELVPSLEPDEADDFDKLDLSMRQAGVLNQWLIMFNPPYVGHTLWEKFFEGNHIHIEVDGFQVPISTHPNVHHVHTTWLDNKRNLPQSYIDLILRLREKNPKKYARQFIGTWLEDSEGVIFQNWREGVFPEDVQSIFGLDWGFWPDPLALIEVVVDEENYLIYARQKMYGTRFSVEYIEDGLREALSDPNDLIVCDTDEARTAYQLKRKGFNLKKALKGPGSVRRDLIEIQDWTLVIDPQSHDIKKERKLYLWDDKKASIPKGEHDHTLKAIIYAWRRWVGRYSTKE